MSAPGGSPRTPRWQWVVTAAIAAGSFVSSIASNVVANLVGSNLNALTWSFVGMTALGGGGLALLDWRRRRLAQQQRAADPAESVPEQSPGVPTDLPYTSGFTGRRADLDWIIAALEDEHAVAVVGRRAVGTSTCAVQAANVVRDRFDEGPVYLDLRGAGRQLSPRQVLGALGRKLGTPPPRSARWQDLQAAGAAIRHALADKQTLLVLDNVASDAQVRALLPPAPSCRLLFAGSPQLTTLDGVAIRWLEEPDARDAVEMFAAAAHDGGIGRTRRADPRTDPAVGELVELCGRQPRIVRALGYRSARHGWRTDELLATLRRAVVAPPHLPVPYAEALALLTRRDSAYRALSRPGRRLFRLLSLAPRPLGREPIAALTRWPVGKVGQLLDELAAGAFVASAEGDRYHVRPLLAALARLHLRDDEPARRRVRAQAGLVRHLARRAERLAATLAVAAVPGPAGLHLDDDPDDWFTLNHDLLRELVVNAAGPPGVGDPLPRTLRRWWFRLAAALCLWYAHEDDLAHWEEVCVAVLGTPTAGDRPTVAGWAHNEIGVIRRRRGDPRGATAALTLAVTERPRRGQGQAGTNLGLALLDQGDVDLAIEYLERARRHRSPADRAGQGLTELGLGAAYLARDDAARARHHLVRAANTFDGIGERRGYAAALTNLVLAQWRLGEHLDAAHAGGAALAEYERLGDEAGRAAALLNTGAMLVSADPPRGDRAHDLLTEARRLRERRDPDAALGRTLLYLGDAALAVDRPEQARRYWQEAADVGEAVGDDTARAAALLRLAS
ncbi:tetratricopeptide repeat protein [Rhizomonospora bruguierae]|uniref:tetratricopeptide repeat protein n=1 Tax=Rhizomonospora bruguierae TaxID=1581705 RepID=UPI001BD0FDB4|nr:tetratricopeptide repeat protein [Micromonospora sp. NBRC 107566]